VFLLASSLAASSLADVRSSATAMACCIKAHNQCAGLSAPDDCCERMGHTSGVSLAGTLSSGQPVVIPPAILATLPPVNLSLRLDAPNSDFAFKRPHDPPHLHPFSLLI
jgi:hypothetical protein